MRIKKILKNSKFIKENLSKILLSIFVVSLMLSLGIITNSKALDKNEAVTQKIENKQYRIINDLNNIKIKGKENSNAFKLYKYNIQLKELYSNLKEYKESIENITKKKFTITTDENSLKDIDMKKSEIESLTEKEISDYIALREKAIKTMNKDYENLMSYFKEYLKENNIKSNTNEIGR